MKVPPPQNKSQVNFDPPIKFSREFQGGGETKCGKGRPPKGSTGAAYHESAPPPLKENSQVNYDPPMKFACEVSRGGHFHTSWRVRGRALAEASRLPNLACCVRKGPPQDWSCVRKCPVSFFQISGGYVTKCALQMALKLVASVKIFSDERSVVHRGQREERPASGLVLLQPLE